MHTRNFKVHPKERFYFILMSIIGIIAYSNLLYGMLYLKQPFFIIYGIYGLLFVGFSALLHLYFIGYLKGNAIKVNDKQFPEAFEIFKAACAELGIEKIPTLWLLQGGGVLNAFATRFRGRNHVIVYSSVFEAAYLEDSNAVRFIIGHELGHIKQNHISFAKSILLLPAKLIPFLSWAYSRSCEYTCDSIGYSVAPDGARQGILILAAGRELSKKVHVQEMLATAQKEKGFAFSFSEIWSTHPHLVKRVEHLEMLKKEQDLNSLKFTMGKRTSVDPFHPSSEKNNESQPPASF